MGGESNRNCEFEYECMYRIRWSWTDVEREHGERGLWWCIAFKLKERCWWRAIRRSWKIWTGQIIQELARDSTGVRKSARVEKRMNSSRESEGKRGGSRGAEASGVSSKGSQGSRRNRGTRAKGSKRWKCKSLPSQYSQEIVTWNIQGYSNHVITQVQRGGRAVQVQQLGKHGALQAFVDHEFQCRRVPVFIFLQETWFRTGHVPFGLDGYEWRGKPRTVGYLGGPYSGGVGVWVHKSIAPHVQTVEGGGAYGIWRIRGCNVDKVHCGRWEHEGMVQRVP